MKFRIPKSKFQTNSRLQFECWILGFVWCLKIDVWNFVGRIIFCFVISSVMGNVLYSQIQGVAKMLGTKHNLSVSGTGAIRASSELQLCVFCHTPHVPRQYASEQLWNHQSSSAEYTLYSSDYLTNLNYSAPNQPNARSKLCLSCHDGTVAIGAVYNNGGPQTIAMQNDIKIGRASCRERV